MADRARLLSTFLELVEIDSVSLEERGLARYIAARLAPLGVDVTHDNSSSSTGSNTDNLLCALPGDDSLPRIMFVMHMDTVEPGRGVVPVVKGNVITSEGETVLGADDKAGVAVSIELVRRVVEEGISHGVIDLVYTVAEEKGLVGARHMDLSRIPRPDYVYVLDAEGPPGNIVVAAPYYETLRAVFRGRTAHAGIEPEKGANAIAAAARAISSMPVGRIDHETTSNIGTIQGGRERNCVPDLCEITGEARSLDPEKLAAAVEKMRAALEEAAGDGVSVDIELERAFEGFNLSREHPDVALAARALEATGIEPVYRRAGGGSDANVFNALDLPAVCLSVGYQSAHAIEEELSISDLEKSLEYLLQLVRLASSEHRERGS